MASTYSALKVELIGTGDQSGTWGNTTNTNLGNAALGEAITGSADVTFASADVTVTLVDSNASQTARNLRLNLIGTSSGARNLILGSGCQIEKLYLINNAVADTVTVKNTTGSGIAVPAGKSMFVYNNGTDVVEAISYVTGYATSGANSNITSLSGLTTPLSVAQGGIGASTLAAANIGQLGYTTTTTSGTTTTLTATSTSNQFFTGSTTQSVQLPVTSTLVLGQTFQIHNNSTGNVTVISSGSDTVLVVSGNTSATLTCILTSGTDAASWDADITGFTTALTTLRGGTGQTTYTDGQVLIGNTSTGSLAKATISGASGVTVTNGAGTITLAPTSGFNGFGARTVSTSSPSAGSDGDIWYQY
jgi:hypothetical protein